jgi:uncharacterized protein (TIGR02231 family)
MKYLVIILSLIFIINIFSAEIDSKNKISQVSVFKDRAFITRKMNRPVKKGNHSFVFYPITSEIDEDSLKVLTGNGSSLKILGVRTKVIQHKEVISKDIQKFQKESLKIKQQISTITTKVQGLIKEHKELSNLTSHYQDSFSLNLHAKKWSRASLISYLRFIDSRNKKMKGSWKIAFKAYLVLVERQNFINQKIREFTSGNTKQQLKVWVDTQVTKTSNVQLKLQYLVKKSGWRPVYDLRILNKKKSAFLEQSAMVWQNTGEDWNNVKLTLSNQQSELRPTIPSLNSYTLNFKKVEKVKTIVKSSQVDSESLSGAGDNQDLTKEDLAKKFIVSGTQTVKSHRPQVKVPIATKKARYREWNELVAKQFPKVYTKGEVKNPFDWTLPSSEANIFYNGNFIQKFTTQTVRKGEHFYINAGLDYSITVSRNYNDKSQKAGLLNGEKVYQRKFHTYLKNYSAYKKTIRVYEQIPESELDNVKVSFETSAKSYKKDKDRPSWIYWTLNLPSQKEMRIEHTLKVEAPKDFHFSW